MKPNDSYCYTKGLPIAQRSDCMARYYQPIIGVDATVLYSYLLAFWDNGQSLHKFSEILNHVQFGMSRFQEALALLTAMDLVAFYQNSDNYLFHLKPALSATEFLANPAYRRLLEKKIGEVAVKDLEDQLPHQARNLSKQFSDVFSDFGDLKLKSQPKTTFDWDSFEKRMLADGLRLAREQEDVIALYSMAEQYRLTWFDLYQVAKETAHNHMILPQRISAKLDRQETVQVPEDFSPQEKILLNKAKSGRPQAILAEIKKGRRANVTTDELKVLDELATMNFLDEVINVMVIYTLAKTQSANLNKTYIMKIANDFAYQEVKTAEVAVTKMRSFDQRKKDRKPKEVKSNVPEWTKEDYKQTATAEELAQLEALRQRMLKD
ncbi:DnaD domain protein [Streptococcus plurextorum]|uniref:DnaD domain protein n=1 Tax=Streptococcus plurextorum TaxID=456876 RepID=UPI000413E1F4|nr:DnaD domain protein [Streptococcus plurextorum]